MPKKKKIVEEETVEVEELIVEEEKPLETDEELTVQVKDKIFSEESKVETLKEKAKKPSDTVKVKVLIGTLNWEGGSFKKGEVFQCSRKRALRFESADVEILE